MMGGNARRVECEAGQEWPTEGLQGSVDRTRGITIAEIPSGPLA